MTSVSDDSKILSPMLCPACNNSYVNPRLLPCLHSVCYDCLNLDKTSCPVCKRVIPPLPDIPVDMLLEYLVTNKHSLDGVCCANCDTSHPVDTMLFCNTCSQPLCKACRNATHSAKMFAKHDIVDSLSQRLNNQRLCSLHNEPFIMYNAEDKSLVCISCFREIGLSKRSHCIDIESAYTSVQTALNKSMEYTASTQNRLSASLQDLDHTIVQTEESCKKRLEYIRNTYTNIVKAVELCKERLTESCNQHRSSSLDVYRGKQQLLSELQPILQNTLTAAHLFTSVSDRFDLVEYGTYVIERLQALTSKVTQVQPLSLTPEDVVDCRKEFTECLGLTLSDKKLPVSTDSKLHDNIRAELIAYHRGISRSGSGPGSMYCKQLEQKSVRISELQRCLSNYKNQIQELHRDITIRRSSAGASKTSSLTKNCEDLLHTITEETCELRQLQPLLENSWKETLNSVVKQQEKYKDRMSVVDKMKNETQHLITMVKQLTPFIHSYKDVSARIHPKLLGSSGENSLDNMSQIIQTINEITPDSDQRIAAIEQAEREKSEHKKCKNVLEEDLQKQKGKLRSVVNSSEDISLL